MVLGEAHELLGNTIEAAQYAAEMAVEEQPDNIAANILKTRLMHVERKAPEKEQDTKQADSESEIPLVETDRY